MANVKKYTRLLVLCLLATLLLNNISLARMSGFGGHHTSGFGGHHTSGFGGHHTSGFGGHHTSGFGGHHTSGFGGHHTSGFGGHHMSGFGGHRISGGFHHSGRFFNSRFQPFYSNFQYPMIVGSLYYGYGVNYDTTSRYDNFPYSTGSRYDNFPYPSQPQYVQQSQGNTYNNSNNTYNYTYNYYGGAEGSSAQSGSASSRSASPQKSEVGIYYENGVAAFKDGDYVAAAENFQRASRPANKFMPLAYTQALFANGNYAQAAEQLRLAIDKLSPENDKILFPGFLHPSNQILLSQIEILRKHADTDSDFQFLVGYQLFGVKKMDEAVTFLNKAKSNSVNEPAATKLLLMIKKTRTATNS